MSKRKPLLIDPHMLKPLPQELWGTACTHCHRPQARWSMGVLSEFGGRLVVTDYEPTCAVCFLYDTQWGKTRAEDVKGYIEDCEKAQHQKFLVDPAGRLTPAAADKLLGVIALTSRMFQLRRPAAPKVE